MGIDWRLSWTIAAGLVLAGLTVGVIAAAVGGGRRR